MKEHDVFLVTELLAAHFDLVETDQDWSDKELASGNVAEYRKYAVRFAEAHRAGIRIAQRRAARSSRIDARSLAD